MTTKAEQAALVERNAHLQSQTDVTDEQLALVKKTVATGATDNELKLFLYDCQRHGVHPLDKLLHFTKRGGKYVPITSIDLMRQRAASTGEYLGCSKPVWTGQPGHQDSKVEMVAKRAVGSHIAEHWGEAYWSEYCPPPGQDHMWKKMPHVMLAKVCEAICLRKGFPKELAGVYEASEMDQAKEQTVTQALYEDFPIDTWIPGVITKILPVAGTMPAQLFIQGENGTSQLSTLLPMPMLTQLVNESIEYKYGKQGRLRVVTEIRQQGQVSHTTMELQHPEGSAAADIADAEWDKQHDAPIPQLIDDGDGEPDESAFFAPDTDVRGVLVSFNEGEVTRKKDKAVIYKCDLVFECADGQIEVTSWDKPGKWLVNWQELLDKNVWFNARESGDYRGKIQYTLQDISHYNKM
jgi:phage recombination protein Bet